MAPLRKLPLLIALALLTTALSASAAVDPFDAFSKARSHIASKQYREALALLEPALESAATMTDAATRSQAVSAIHFYTALAHSQLKSESEAREHLQAYFAVTPNAKRIDPNKYDKAFVALFDEVAGNPSGASSRDRFETYYPSFSGFQAPPTEPTPDGTWGTSPVIEILASKAEAAEWREVLDPAARAKFIAEFWKRRDATPATPQNEFREQFERRVAFADSIFGAAKERGSLTDRGRVFVLLGEPAFLRRRPISRSDAVRLAYRYTMVNGTIEAWIYVKDQLPSAIGKPQVSYRFVTQLDIGDNVLQRQEDAFAMQALALAAGPAIEP
ncbi:MAG: GWxTD domain-containing protein [Thermoanaerobaculia bacterium]